MLMCQATGGNKTALADMSSKTLQHLLDELLWDIYGKVSLREKQEEHFNRSYLYTDQGILHICPDSWKYPVHVLQEQTIESLTQISASMRLEIRIIGCYLTRVLIKRDRKRRQQEFLCSIVTACLQAFSDKSAEAKDMRFALSPPSPPKIDLVNNMGAASSDFNQWLHAMKMVARLPGGMPPEFRRKLWLALADRHLQTKNVDWKKEQEKCFSEQWREDDEELGIQIVKDLHRTGSSLCSGPAGSLNQAKLKRVLLGYARWNPEVGYCQGFNMLGALILQVMDKSEEESMKVMIYLIEGVLPPGYFSGSLGGLQADMAVFRELMTSKVPKLAKHLQRLQGPIGEGSFEPPLTNVFTMQWFLTLFCTCLPINCVLRVWDLILIEGSDVLLRTALGLWSLLEGKIIATKTADDFYCRMGTLSGELLNGHLIDSNGLIEKVVELGPISDLQKLREKHLYNIAPWQDKKGLRLFYSDDEADSDEDSRLAVATVWGLRLNRRGSSSSSTNNKTVPDNKDRIALDISLLKKQYDRLRERQRQAHIILTTAVAKQGANIVNPSPPLQMNQLLMGRSAIVTNKGRRLGPPQGSIPPARKLSNVNLKPVKSSLTKPVKRGETLHWHDTEAAKRRRSSITINETNSSKKSSTKLDSSHSYSDTASSSRSNISEKVSTTKPRTRKKSESSSYSEDSDANSSTSTSLCDDEEFEIGASSLEASPLRKFDKSPTVPRTNSDKKENHDDNEVPDIVLINLDTEENSKVSSVPGGEACSEKASTIKSFDIADEDSSAECDRFSSNKSLDSARFNELKSNLENNEYTSTVKHSENVTLDKKSFSITEKPVDSVGDDSEFPRKIANTSQLSPIDDARSYVSSSALSPIKSPKSFTFTPLLISNKNEDTDDSYDASEEGVINEYFERVNIVERPKNLSLYYSLNERDTFLTGFELPPTEVDEGSNHLTEQQKDDTKECGGSTEVIPREEKALLTKSYDISPKDQSKEHSSLERSPSSPSKPSMLKHSIRNHHNIDREKSFSFDDTTKVEKEEPRPTSCPEARADIAEGKCRSDRVLKIIEENSKILHRILKKHTTGAEEEANEKLRKESILSESRDLKQTESYKADTDLDLLCKSDTSVLCMDYPKENFLTSPTYKNSFMTPYGTLDNKTSIGHSNKGQFNALYNSNELFMRSDRDRSSSRPRSRTESILRDDYNIADRLESIKNTIKSIDSICDERAQRRERCQKSVDAFLEQRARIPPLINISEPISDFNFNQDYTRDSFSSYSTGSRYSREFTRDASPRWKIDEDKEELESRVRRDNQPMYSTCLGYREEPSSDFTIRNNNKSPTRYNNEISDNIKDDDLMATSSSYIPNRIEIRHTTVTSTMYDRYLYQKMERNAKGEKSPPSPVITKAYLDSLKPNSPSFANRYARSAENSPSRDKLSSCMDSTSPKAITPGDHRQDLQIRSCDNILMQLSCSALTTTTTTQPYSPLSSPKSYQPSLITIKPYRGPLDATDSKT